MCVFGLLMTEKCLLKQSIFIFPNTLPRQCINTITLRDKKQELAYFIYFFVLSWLLPILVMLFCYVSIIVTICRRQSHNHSLTNNSENARGE